MKLVIPVFIPHLGCPHDCLFCNQQKISGTAKVEETSIDSHFVTRVIQEWLSQTGPKNQYEEVQVAFYGGSFTCLPSSQQKKLLAQVVPFIEKGKVDSIRCSTRPDCVDTFTCDLLRQHHVTTVELGVQSLNDTVLQTSLRGHNSTQCQAAVELLQKYGFEVGIQLMLGLPGDTTKSLFETIVKTVALKPKFVRLYPLLVVKGSALEKLYLQGNFTPLTLGKAIVLAAHCYNRLKQAGIDVIRMGLQPSDSLDKNVLAGPHHPAFGEMVRSHLLFKELRKNLAQLKPEEKLEITVSPKDMSMVVGNKKRNISRLEQLGFGGRFTIIQDKTLPRNSRNYVICK